MFFSARKLTRGGRSPNYSKCDIRYAYEVVLDLTTALRAW